MEHCTIENDVRLKAYHMEHTVQLENETEQNGQAIMNNVVVAVVVIVVVVAVIDNVQWGSVGMNMLDLVIAVEGIFKDR